MPPLSMRLALALVFSMPAPSGCGDDAAGTAAPLGTGGAVGTATNTAAALPGPPRSVLSRLDECQKAMDARDAVTLEHCYADNATTVVVDAGREYVGGKAAVDGLFRPWWSGFAELSMAPRLTLLNDRIVVQVLLVRGRHTGRFMEVPSTGAMLGVLAGRVTEWSDYGRMVRDEHYLDGTTLLSQLGAIPPHRPVASTAEGEHEHVVVSAAGSEEEAANLALLPKLAEAFNAHDVGALMAFYAEDVLFADMAAPRDIRGRKKLAARTRELFVGYSDLKLDIPESWAAGEYVVAIVELTGAHDGDLPGIDLARTGKAVMLRGLEVYKIADGAIQEEWLFWNGMALARQLGLVTKS